mmetsp:Transcript_151309/g.384626  ORF Transcript_151309/g.384626 Transcript_151309/m.384626 type:complete len:98 (-) Transcript_151309:424-717(-)
MRGFVSRGQEQASSPSVAAAWGVLFPSEQQNFLRHPVTLVFGAPNLQSVVHMFGAVAEFAVSGSSPKHAPMGRPESPGALPAPTAVVPSSLQRWMNL